MMSKKTGWTDEFYVRSYQLARNGLTNGQIATTLGVTTKEFREWLGDKSALEEALKEGRNRKAGLENCFIYGKLSERAQSCWKRVLKAEKEINSVRKIELLFDKYGDGIRKELFLHCLAGSNFNPTQACRRVGIPYGQFKRWIEDDYEFSNLMMEMQDHKGDLFEEKFIELVNEKEPSVVIHAAKTYNRKRGYGDKIDINLNGEVKNSHVFELSEKLMDLLSIGARRELMGAMKQLEEKKDPITVDAL